MKNEKGFSMIELLIAIAIAAFVGMAGYAIFSSSGWSQKIQEDVAEAQQNIRVSVDRLSKDIRTAGFGLPDPPFSITIGGQTFIAPITVTNSSAAPDTITILGIGYESGSLQGAGSIICDNGIGCNNSGANCVCLSTPASESIDNFFSGGGSFDANRGFINLGGGTYIELAASGHNQGNRVLKIASPPSLERDFRDGTAVYIIQAVQYSIVDNDAGASPPCTAATPCLRSQDLTGLRGSGSITLAESIEDIQFAYGIDVSPRDGRIDDSDLDGSFTTADFVDSPLDASSIVAVRMGIVARTRNQDPRSTNISNRPALEDRAAGASDGYRRRVLTKVIRLRNPRVG